jgi:hypothetical protein
MINTTNEPKKYSKVHCIWIIFSLSFQCFCPFKVKNSHYKYLFNDDPLSINVNMSDNSWINYYIGPELANSTNVSCVSCKWCQILNQTMHYLVNILLNNGIDAQIMLTIVR